MPTGASALFILILWSLFVSSPYGAVDVCEAENLMERVRQVSENEERKT